MIGIINSEILALLFCQGSDGSVMIADAVNQLPFLIFNTLTGFHHADISVTEIWHGADNQFWSILLIAEH